MWWQAQRIVLSWWLPEWTRKTCNSTFKIAVSRLRLKRECNSVCVCDSSHQNYVLFNLPAADWHNWVLQGCSLSKVHYSVTFELNKAFYFSVGGGTWVRVTHKQWPRVIQSDAITALATLSCDNVCNMIWVLWVKHAWPRLLLQSK